MHTRGKPIAKDIDLDALAAQTPGFTGADLANLVNEAALLAARHGKKQIDMLELEEGIMRVLAGPEKKSRLISEKEKAITAYHEMGHALVGHFLPNTDPVHKISVVSRGQALGFTISLPTEDKFLTTKAEIIDNLAMTLGGRAAEEVVFGEITTGAANDLEKATEHGQADDHALRHEREARARARSGTTRRCRSSGASSSQQPDYSEEIAREIDDEIRRIIEEAHQRASGILLTEHREQLDGISQDPHRPRDDRAPTSSRRCSTAVRRKRSSARRTSGSGSARRRSARVGPRRCASRRGSASRRRSTRSSPRRPDAVDRAKIEESVRLYLEGIGEDPQRPGLIDTPRRVADMYEEIYFGLDGRPCVSCWWRCPATSTRRWCWSRTSPSTRSASTTCCRSPAGPTSPTSRARPAASPGLSKLARVVDVAARPQLQERITSTVADAMMETLKPMGVLVLIEAEHLCMSMRGVRSPGSKTVTSAVRGIVESHAATRAEVFALVNARH